MSFGKKILNLILFIAVATSATGQVKFQRTFGIGLYNEGRCVKQTLDGGYIVAGTSSDAGPGSADFYLIKTDSLGNFQWHRVYGGHLIDRAYSVIQTADSGYVVCGYSNSFGVNNNYDGYLLKTDLHGDTLWTKTFGGTDWDFIYSMQQTSDAGFILAGNSYSNVNGRSEAFLVRTDSTGELLWEKSLGMPVDVFINAIAISPDSSFVLAGYTSDAASANDDMFIIKTNPSGDTLWTKTIGAVNSEEHLNSIDVSKTDSSIVTGGYRKSSPANPYEEYMFKLDRNGDSVWTQVLSGTGDQVIHDIHFRNDTVIAAGYTASFGLGGKDVKYYTINPASYYINGGTKGGIADDIGYHIEPTSDGGYIVCGSSASFKPGLQSLYLIKLDSLFTTSALVISVEENRSVISGVAAYPNPFHESTVLQLDGIHPKGKLLFSVFNSTGQLVFSSSVKEGANITFNRNELPSGIYMYRLSDSEKLLGYGKLVLQ